MVETVDTHCELPQAQLFGAQQLADSWRQPLSETDISSPPAIPIRRSSNRHEL